MNLKEEFHQILEEYGHPILLIRMDRKVRCWCFDEKTQTSSRTCPTCAGLSYVPLIEKHIVRDVDTSIVETLPLAVVSQKFGEMSITSRAYFFKNIEIGLKDCIVDCEFQGDQVLYRGEGIYEISHVDPARFEKGETVFKKVYVKDQPVLKNLRGFRLVEIAGKPTYQWIGGERA